MSQRILYLAAYDIADDTRLRRALYILRDYATGGQKSVFECYLDAREKTELINRIAAVIHPREDRFFLIRLSQQAKTRVLGLGVAPRDPGHYYFG